MNITERKISDIIPYENNPRNNKNAVEKVAESIKEFGFKVPIIVDKGGIIVAGHTRLEAAKLLGLKKVPVIVADDLTPEQVKAYRLADNKVAEFSTWDFKKLNEELSGLGSTFNFEVFGFGQFNAAGCDDLFLPQNQKPRDNELNNIDNSGEGKEDFNQDSDENSVEDKMHFTCPQCGYHQ